MVWLHTKSKFMESNNLDNITISMLHQNWKIIKFEILCCKRFALKNFQSDIATLNSTKISVSSMWA